MLAKEAIYKDKRDDPSASSPSDESYIAACLAGEEWAWEALIKKYSRLIYSIPFHHGLSDSQAADVFQSVCLKLLENLRSLRDCTKLSSWLITTTTRECWNVTRKQARYSHKDDGTVDEELDPLDPSPLPDEAIMLLEEHQAVRNAFQHLPAKDQRLLWYLFYDKSGSTYAEIAKRLGIPEGSVGPLRARSLEKLRNLLEKADLT